MFYLYILESIETKRFYVGSTNDLKRRIKEHNAGKNRSTKFYMPWRLIYYEAYITMDLARKAEIFYKKSQGRRQIKKKLNIDIIDSEEK
jgi:putative endonuclease